MSQQNIWAHGWVLITIFPSFWAFVAKYSLPFIAFRLQNTASSDMSLALITNWAAPVCSSHSTSLSPVSSACWHHSRIAGQWQYSWGRPHWQMKQRGSSESKWLDCAWVYKSWSELPCESNKRSFILTQYNREENKCTESVWWWVLRQRSLLVWR